jgi:preprotein translocase subunit SecD
MARCPSCGSDLRPNGSFCTACGAVVASRVSRSLWRSPWVLAVLALVIGAGVLATVLLTQGRASATRNAGASPRHGDLEVVYQAKTASGGVPSSEQMSKVMTIMEQRVKSLGVSAQLSRRNDDQVSVILSGVTDSQRVLGIIGETGQLEFYDDGTQRIAGPASSLADAVSQAKAQQTKYKISAADLEALGDPKAAQPACLAAVTAPSDTVGNTTTQYFVYLRPPKMTGSAIKDARQSSENGQPDIAIDFTPVGGDEFAAVTRELSDRGALLQQGQTFAIVLDNVMRSDPYVDYEQNPQGITGGSAVISGGNMTVKDAQYLALVLRIGALPVDLTIVQQSSLK